MDVGWSSYVVTGNVEDVWDVIRNRTYEVIGYKDKTKNVILIEKAFGIDEGV